VRHGLERVPIRNENEFKVFNFNRFCGLNSSSPWSLGTNSLSRGATAGQFPKLEPSNLDVLSHREVNDW